MSKFITLSMFIEQKGTHSRYRPEPPAPVFLDWKLGYVVRSKTSANGEHFTITAIDGASEPHNSNYHSTFYLSNDTGEDRRTVKGGTLQGGYTYVSGAPVPEPEKDTQPLVVNVDAIREFYARKSNRPGSRVGVGIGTRCFYIVQESAEQIAEALRAVLQEDQVVVSVAGTASLPLTRMLDGDLSREDPV